MKKIAVFGSGSGSNAENLCNYFAKSNLIKVVFICTNNKKAFIVKRAKKLHIPLFYITKSELSSFSALHKNLQNYSVDYIVLAGFLLKLPVKMVDSYPKKIINIHPSLLPKYGGKGMYGMLVHESVVKNKESETGITIHYVNENYDEGTIIFQKSFQLSENDTSESVANKIHELEYEFFPKVIEEILDK